MTWQDELQNLDAELAAGRISAEEYRQRRDTVLGRAQGGQTGPPQSNPDGFPQQDQTQQADPSSGGFPQQQPAQQQQQPSSPFPPAFSWGDAAKQQPQQQGGDDATQVVPNPFHQQQQQQPPADSNSTQIVSVPQTPQQQQQWGQSQPPWAGQQQGPQGWGPVETTGTPWGDDLPGSGDSGEASWMRQGPEVFESAGKSGKGKLIAGLSIGAVLLVVVIVAVVFYFTSSSGGGQPEGETAAPPPPAPTTSQLPAPPAAKAPPATTQEVLVAANGPAHPWVGLLDLPNLQGAKGGLLQPKTVLDTAFQNGLVEGWFNGTEGAQPKTTLLALKMPDTNAAQTVVEKYLAAQQGLSEMEDLSYQGVSVVSTGATFRTAYVAHNYAVIIDVSGPPEQKDAAQQSFKAVLDQQLTQTPPTVTG